MQLVRDFNCEHAPNINNSLENKWPAIANKILKIAGDSTNKNIKQLLANNAELAQTNSGRKFSFLI